MPASTLQGDVYVAGNFSAKSFTPPAQSIADAAIAGSAGVQASKIVRHQSLDVELFPEGSAVTAVASKLLHVVKGAVGTLVAIQAAIFTQATGSDRTVSVDLQKSTGGGAFASILTAPIAVDHTTAIRTAAAATIASDGLVAGDILRLVVVVAGSASAQAAGLLVSVTLEETYQ